MKKVYIFFILIFALAYFFVIYIAPVLAATNFSAGLETARGSGGYPEAKDPMNFLAKMLGNALTPMFMGVTGMLSIMYGGYKWMMSHGNEQEVELGKTIIINTIIALFVAFSAYGIVNAVIRLLVNKTGI